MERALSTPIGGEEDTFTDLSAGGGFAVILSIMEGYNV